MADWLEHETQAVLNEQLHDRARQYALMVLLRRDRGLAPETPIVVHAGAEVDFQMVAADAYAWARSAQFTALGLDLRPSFGERLVRTRKRDRFGQGEVLAEATGELLDSLRVDGEVDYTQSVAMEDALDGFVDVVAGVFPDQAPTWFSSPEAHGEQLRDHRRAFETGVVMCAAERMLLRAARFERGKNQQARGGWRRIFRSAR